MKIHRIIAAGLGLYLVAAPLYIAAVTPAPLPAAGGLMLFAIMFAGLCAILAAAIAQEA